jgi:hypothetical protein
MRRGEEANRRDAAEPPPTIIGGRLVECGRADRRARSRWPRQYESDHLPWDGDTLRWTFRARKNSSRRQDRQECLDVCRPCYRWGIAARIVSLVPSRHERPSICATRKDGIADAMTAEGHRQSRRRTRPRAAASVDPAVRAERDDGRRCSWRRLPLIVMSAIGDPRCGIDHSDRLGARVIRPAAWPTTSSRGSSRAATWWSHRGPVARSVLRRSTASSRRRPGSNAPTRRGWQAVVRVGRASGSEALERLVQPPLALEREAAIERLTGVIIGPGRRADLRRDRLHPCGTRRSTPGDGLDPRHAAGDGDAQTPMNSTSPGL